MDILHTIAQTLNLWMDMFQLWLDHLPPLLVHVVLFVLLLIEGMGMPGIPFEFVWLAEGLLIHAGKTTLTEAILWGTIGNWLGNLLGYMLGDRLARVLPEKARNALSIDEVREWLKRWGVWVVLFSRWMGLIRTPFILYAGAAGMPFWSYALWSFVGALSWVGVWQVALYYFGEQFMRWWEHYQIYIVGGGILIGVLSYMLLIRKRKA